MHTITTLHSLPGVPICTIPVGVTTVTYTAEDDRGNISTCAFTVEVQDIEAPVLTCPPNQVFSATCPDAQIQDYRNLVNISDNCSGDVTLTQTWAPVQLWALFLRQTHQQR
ncbi:MAG: HYR domain-containing protein [Saprospiraceae bacterium]